jgi:hypothetical protein
LGSLWCRNHFLFFFLRFDLACVFGAFLCCCVRCCCLCGGRLCCALCAPVCAWPVSPCSSSPQRSARAPAALSGATQYTKALESSSAAWQRTSAGHRGVGVCWPLVSEPRKAERRAKTAPRAPKRWRRDTHGPCPVRATKGPDKGTPARRCLLLAGEWDEAGGGNRARTHHLGVQQKACLLSRDL